METMTDEQRRDFLAVPGRTAALATTRPDGRPHVVPIWFVSDGDDLLFTTWRTSVKGRNLAREPRAALTVDDPSFPFAFVVVEGTCTFEDNPPEMLSWATRIAERYVPAGRAEEFGRRNAVDGELLVRLTPTRVTAQRDIVG